MNGISRAAIALARRGTPVFPCDSNKRPMTSRGFYAATTDENQIGAWFNVADPPYIGIPTGEASGLWVLDVDRKNGVDGQDALDKLIAEHNELPDTVISLTPSGGLHYVFRWTEQVKTTSGQLGPGLDVRGDGGYFIVPPSGKDGRRYEWEASNPKSGPAVAPEWLQRLVAPPSPRERRPYVEPTDQERKRALAALMAIKFDGQSRDEWVEIGMAYAAAGGCFESFDAWCAAQPGYNAENVRKEWDSFSPDGGVGPGTLYHHAKRHGWQDGPRFSFHGGRDERPPMELETAFNQKGEPVGYKPTLSNVVTVLEQHEKWEGRLLYNEMTRQMELSGRGGVREVDDAVVHEIRVWLDTGLKWSAKPSRALVFDAVEVVTHRATYHPVRDYLASLQWDGTERLPFWLDDVCGIAKTPYTMAVAAKFLIGAVARIMEPGCKLDTMPVFVGEQGIHKSTMLRELFHGWHVDTPVMLGSKDAYQCLNGAWVYEFAELASFHGKEVEKLKAFFSSAADTYRPSYGRYVVTVPRGCVFVATTNDTEIFHDTTGARRFWPVSLEHVDLKALRELRDQLWAEAVHEYHRGEPWHMEGEAEELQAAAAESHQAIDPWEELLSSFTFNKDKVSVRELFEHLEIDPAKRTKGDSMRVTRVMCDRLKWKKQAVWLDGGAVKGFRRTSRSVNGLRPVK